MPYLAKRLLPEAIRLLQAIGRWVLRRVSERGRKHVIQYMQGRVDLFRDRLFAAKTMLHRGWLQGRINRWESVIKWLKAHWVTKKIARCLDQAMTREVQYSAEKAMPI